MSEYKRITGSGRIRVRGIKSVSYCAIIKSFGVNILRSSKAYFASDGERLNPLFGTFYRYFSVLMLLFPVDMHGIRKKVKSIYRSIKKSPCLQNIYSITELGALSCS